VVEKRKGRKSGRQKENMQMGCIWEISERGIKSNRTARYGGCFEGNKKRKGHRAKKLPRVMGNFLQTTNIN